MTNLEYATQNAKRSVRQRAAGKHALTNLEIAQRIGGEWGLRSLELTQLRREIQVEDERLRELSK